MRKPAPRMVTLHVVRDGAFGRPEITAQKFNATRFVDVEPGPPGYDAIGACVTLSRGNGTCCLRVRETPDEVRERMAPRPRGLNPTYRRLVGGHD